MKEVLDEQGILFISDEVQTAWGRTGDHFWGYQAHGITPDIITFAKGIGNGLAIAGVIARAEIMDSIAANSISTFGGNPLSTAGALANLDFMLENDLQTNAKKIGEHMFGRFRHLEESNSIVGDVRGKGLMIGIELVEPGGKSPAPERAARAMEEAKSRGVLIGKGGLYGNTLRITPPMTISMEQADDWLRPIDRVDRGGVVTTVPHWLNGGADEGAPERVGDVYDPSTGDLTKQVAFATPELVDRAVAGAKAAFETWRASSMTQQGEDPLRLPQPHR